MSSIIDCLEDVAKFARRSISHNDTREFYFAALGIRADGVKVISKNGSAKSISPEIHAEARLSKKLTSFSTVFVARVRKLDGHWVNAKPCRSCRNKLRSRRVRMVYYTICEGQYGVIDLDKFKEQACKVGRRLKRFEIGRWHRRNNDHETKNIFTN
jgi:hypothetical protein